MMKRLVTSYSRFIGITTKRNFTEICKKRDKGFLFKQELHNGTPKFGIFLNSASPVVAEQCSQSGYDWLLVDTQHGPMNSNLLSSMLSGISNGKSLSMVRVGGSSDRNGIQQALDLGANGILIPYVNNAKEVREGVSCCLYPTKGTRSVYFPQRSTNQNGLLGYVGNSNKNVIVAVQIETKDSIDNIDEIVGTEGVDIVFLGQNDLCMSMGLYEKYVFPEMYTSPELNEATQKLINACKKHKKIPGVFLFGTDRVAEFLNLGFPFVSIGNDLHHVLTQNAAHINKLEEIAEKVNKSWKRQHTALF